jgi:hypothetical protein
MEVVHQHGAGAERGEDAQAEKTKGNASLLQMGGGANGDDARRALREGARDLKSRLTHTRRSWREVAPDESSLPSEAGDTSTLFSVEQMELFAGLEAYRFAGSNADLGAGTGVPADARFAWADIKDAEAAQLDTLAFGERALEGLEHGVDRGFGFVALQAGALNHLVNDVLFYQGFLPSAGRSIFKVIVEMFDGIVNAPRLP